MNNLYGSLCVLLTSMLRCGWCELACNLKESACTCEGYGFPKVNIEEPLKASIGKVIRDPDQPFKYNYYVNFCSGATCIWDLSGATNAVACQRQIDGRQNISSKLGDVNHYSWRVFGNNTYAITFNEGDPASDGPRSTMLYVFVVNKTDGFTLNTVTFLEKRYEQDDKGHARIYVFSLYVDSPSPRTSTGTKLSVVSLFLIVFMSIVGLVIFCCIIITCTCSCLVMQDGKKNIPIYSVVDDVKQPLIQ